MNIPPRDIDALIELFDSSDWDEMHLQIGDFELFVSTDPEARQPGHGLNAPAPLRTPPLAATAPAPASAGQPASGGPSATVAAAVAVPSNWVPVKAPNLGTFYRAPKPGAPAFVEIGQSVEPDTEICLIEVMKLFTTLKAGVKGVIKQVCVQDANMVEFGDTLFYIEPA